VLVLACLAVLPGHAMARALLDKPAVAPAGPNPLAPWELRIEELRVYYDVEEEPEELVIILAVGIKDRSRIIIGGEEVEL